MNILFAGVRANERSHIDAHKVSLSSEAHYHFTDSTDLASLAKEYPQTQVLSVFVGTECSAENLKAFQNLKCIVTRSTGYDHIDLEYCEEKGIVVMNVPEYGSETVAEFTVALMLSLSRKIYQAYEQVREDGSFRNDELEGFDLSGKTVGVVGTGKIGRKVIERLSGFGVRLIAYDVKPDSEYASKHECEYVSLEELLVESDLVTLHVPYLEATHHLLNSQAFAGMKKGVYLINTSRGPVIDSQALLQALHDGIVAGAALDVLEEESFTHDEASALLTGDISGVDFADVVANHAFIDMPNVIVTPHVAYNTREAVGRIISTTFENITSFIHDTYTDSDNVVTK